jgi:hypothetical protein
MRSSPENAPSARWGTLAYGVEMPALMMKQERREPAT